MKSKNFVLLCLVLCYALLVRFWKLEERTLFSGEATIELMSLRDLVEKRTSFLVGFPAATYVKTPTFYTTPWFLYLLAPIFLLFRGNPSAFIALHPLLGVLGIITLYYAGKFFYSEKAGLFAVAIYASSMTMVNLDRSVWSLGLVPLITNLVLLSAALSRKRETKNSFLLLGLMLGLAVSLHNELWLSMGLVVGWVWLKHRRMFHWVMIPILASLIPLAMYELTHQFPFIRGWWGVLLSLANNTRPYGTGYFLYQFYAPIILGIGIVLARINQKIALFIFALFLAVELQAFLAYHVSPNYVERKTLMTRLLTYWTPEQGIKIMPDRPYFEYGYLFLWLGKDRGVTENSITVFTPKDQDKERAAKLVAEHAVDINQVQPEAVPELIKDGKVLLVLDEDHIKLLPIGDLSVAK